MKILTEVKCLKPRTLIWRNVANLSGSLLIFAGLILLIPVAVSLLVILAIPGDLEDAWPTILWMVPVFGLSASGVIAGGLNIKRNYRRTVLYLRRFGFADSAKALTYAVSTAIGKRWKLITLDDAKIAPVGLNRSARGLFVIAKWILVALVIAGLAYGANLFYGGGLDRIADGVAQRAPEQPDNPELGVVGNLISKFFTSMIYIIVVGSIAMLGAILGYIATALVIPLAFFAWGASRSVKKAEKRKAFLISNETDLEAAKRKLILKQRRVFSPRLVVVKVANEVWQRVVEVFSVSTDVCLIDVSIPTDNLLWEIRTLREQSNKKWIYVGDKEYILKLQKETSGKASVLEDQLREFLLNEEVLVYDETNRRLMRGFCKSLRNHLENKYLSK